MSLTNHESLKLNLYKTDKNAKPGLRILTYTLVQAVQYLHFTVTQSHSNASLWSLEYSITSKLQKTKEYVKFLVLKVVATWALQISEKWLPTRVFETVFD